MWNISKHLMSLVFYQKDKWPNYIKLTWIKFWFDSSTKSRIKSLLCVLIFSSLSALYNGYLHEEMEKALELCSTYVLNVKHAMHMQREKIFKEALQGKIKKGAFRVQVYFGYINLRVWEIIGVMCSVLFELFFFFKCLMSTQSTISNNEKTRMDINW